MNPKQVTLQKRLFDTIKQPFFRFIGFFFLLLLLFQWITHWTLIREPFTYATTWLVYRIIHWFIPSVTLQVQEGAFHILAGIDMEIIYECTGVYGMIVLLAGVWATRFPWLEKYKISFIGIVLIFLLNLFRLVTLFLISQQKPDWFPFLHTYFWQLFLIWFVVMIFYYWISILQKQYPKAFP